MPVYNHEWAFIHAPKTGGTYVQSALSDFGWRKEGSHDPAHKWVLGGAGGRRLFGVLREPGEWYESVYLHMLRTFPKLEREASFEEAVVAWTEGEMKFWPPLHVFSRMGGIRGPLWTDTLRYWFRTREGDDWLIHTLLDSRRLHEHLTELTGIDSLPLGRMNVRHPGQEVYWDPRLKKRLRQSGDYRIWKELQRGGDIIQLK